MAPGPKGAKFAFFPMLDFSFALSTDILKDNLLLFKFCRPCNLTYQKPLKNPANRLAFFYD